MKEYTLLQNPTDLFDNFGSSNDFELQIMRRSTDFLEALLLRNVWSRRPVGSIIPVPIVVHLLQPD